MTCARSPSSIALYVYSLDAGAVFSGNFSLPKKAGPDWIVVRSGTSDDKLPAP